MAHNVGRQFFSESRLHWSMHCNGPLYCFDTSSDRADIQRRALVLLHEHAGLMTDRQA